MSCHWVAVFSWVCAAHLHSAETVPTDGCAPITDHINHTCPDLHDPASSWLKLRPPASPQNASGWRSAHEFFFVINLRYYLFCFNSLIFQANKMGHNKALSLIVEAQSSLNHYIYVCVCVCVSKWVLVAQLCLTLCNPMDYSPPGSSVHEIFQPRTLEWDAISFSRGSSQPRDQTWVSCIAGRFFIYTIKYIYIYIYIYIYTLV